MKINKIIGILVVAIVVVVGYFYLGKSKSEMSDTMTKKTLKVLIAQPQAGGGKILKEEFEKRTGNNVEITVVPYDQIQTKAILDFQSGNNQYDVIQYWYTSVGALAEAGALEKITDWISQNKEIDESDFIKNIYDPYTLYQGERYGLPIDGDAHVLFYNKEILKRNGVSPPTTWAEYLEAAKTISKQERAKNSNAYAVAVLGAKNAFNIGSSFFNRLSTMSSEPVDPIRPKLNSPAGIEAAQSLIDISPYALPSPLQIGFEQALPKFLGGEIGMIEFWTDLGVFAQDAEKSKIVDNWGVVPLPHGENGKVSTSLNAGWAMGISPNAKDQELAKEFLTFASSKEMNAQLIKTSGSGIDPTRISTMNDPKYNELFPDVASVVKKVFVNAQPWPTSPQAPEMIASLNDNLSLMLQGKLTAKEAMVKTEKDWDELGIESD